MKAHILNHSSESKDQSGRLPDEPDGAQVERKGHRRVAEEGGDADEVYGVVERLEAFDGQEDDSVHAEAHRCGVVQAPVKISLVSGALSLPSGVHERQRARRFSQRQPSPDPGTDTVAHFIPIP